MDVVCSFGRSVNVDGDEWIDLGLPSTPRGNDAGVGSNSTRDAPKSVDDDNNNNPFAVQESVAKLTKTMRDGIATPQRIEPKQTTIKTQTMSIPKTPQNPLTKPNTTPLYRKCPSRAPPASEAASKAARSKEVCAYLYVCLLQTFK
ncbi:unnamed protein product [Phytophthora fragariaefolia]|uniref:Unnamed protein product n=1 Tax=Phytophthora fragariaefolia TaxID=1490495 RepID=A0A9W7CVC0_9STRA|nr:unnamed protein product [Phytophthora fragariaefolia]